MTRQHENAYALYREMTGREPSMDELGQFEERIIEIVRPYVQQMARDLRREIRQAGEQTMRAAA